MNERTTVTALYDYHEEAQSALRELVDMGTPREDISMVASDAAGEYSRYHGQEFPTDRTVRNDTAEEAAAGAAIGGVGGLVIGLAALAIPGIGPVLAAGPLASALVAGGIGAGVGAVVGGMVGALVDLGVNEDEAGYYAEGVRRGGTLLVVTTTHNMSDRVIDVLERHDPIDIEERAASWRESGWSGYDPNAQPYGIDEIERERDRYGARSGTHAGGTHSMRG